MEIEKILKLIDAVSKSDLTGFDYEADGMKLNLTKKQGKVQVVQAGAQNMEGVPNTAAMPETSQGLIPGMLQNAVPGKEADSAAENGNVVSSPLVGTFYAAPAEDAEVFVSVGDTVKKGQTLAIVEAMKLMNEIESDYDGQVTEILVKNGQAVEYGQPLFRIA